MSKKERIDWDLKCIFVERRSGEEETPVYTERFILKTGEIFEQEHVLNQTSGILQVHYHSSYHSSRQTIYFPEEKWKKFTKFKAEYNNLWI